MSISRILLVFMRAAMAVQVILGIGFWTGHWTNLVNVHMAIGALFVVALWVIAGIASAHGRPGRLVAFGFVWGVVVLALGMTQQGILDRRSALDRSCAAPRCRHCRDADCGAPGGRAAAGVGPCLNVQGLGTERTGDAAGREPGTGNRGSLCRDERDPSLSLASLGMTRLFPAARPPLVRQSPSNVTAGRQCRFGEA